MARNPSMRSGAGSAMFVQRSERPAARAIVKACGFASDIVPNERPKAAHITTKPTTIATKSLAGANLRRAIITMTMAGGKKKANEYLHDTPKPMAAPRRIDRHHEGCSLHKRSAYNATANPATPAMSVVARPAWARIGGRVTKRRRAMHATTSPKSLRALAASASAAMAKKSRFARRALATL